ncbi:hypothetical protein [Spiroplasma endosymbiont of Acasis viretata]|uniref:hypothetical protein n=1 Tax=Spiroplasma endosymbiont of Acasis viretata TaxID=3066306 RepID=UPI00313B9791
MFFALIKPNNDPQATKPPFNPIKTNDNPNTKVITPLPRLAILTIINGNNVTSHLPLAT